MRYNKLEMQFPRDEKIWEKCWQRALTGLKNKHKKEFRIIFNRELKKE